MITEVKSFIEKFFQAELDAWNADLGSDQGVRTEKVGTMYSYADESLKNTLGILLNDTPRDRKLRYPEPRKLLKISHYTRGEDYRSEQEKYTNLYICYATDLDSDPDPDFLPLYLCYFVAQNEGSYQILLVYRLGEGYVDEFKKKGPGWFFRAGRKDLLPKDYGEPLTYGVGKSINAFLHFGTLHEIVRYQAPNYGDYSVTEYEKDI